MSTHVAMFQWYRLLANKLWQNGQRGWLHAESSLWHVQAFTWNGFEDGTTFLGGLWAGKTTQQADFATLVYRAQLYGFNAVRIPFRFPFRTPFNLPLSTGCL